MVDFNLMRAAMIDGQLRTSGVTNPRVLAPMRRMPRENFVISRCRDTAYIDDVQWLGAGRFMGAPATLGKMLQLAEIAETDTVLDIGAGTGYSTAVIAGIAQAVIGLEQNATLAATATTNLSDLDITNASVIVGDVTALGAVQFDVVIVQGALDTVPHNFLAHLAPGGRLVALIRAGAVATAHVYVNAGHKVTSRSEFNAYLPPLFAPPAKEEFVF
ncbi:protein-L-isoaspartate O-methyltransferase [Devosia sp. 2618]|uniref:protein-L-isoaspartate O-methyltransferase family protein n=1 Tax=Devosia sp. 2618 TaxID=3156454 RepID=UPI00339A9663